MKAKLAVALLLLCIIVPAARADSTQPSPCTAGTLATIFNTTCTIDNLVFSFGQPFPVDINVVPTQIAFTPLANGFMLGGLNPNTSTVIPNAGDIFLSLPVQISTLNGQATINGSSKVIEGANFTGDAAAFVCFFSCATLNSLVTINPPATFPPVSSASPGIFEDLLTAPGACGCLTGVGSFSSVQFQVSQVPEPGTMTLTLVGICLLRGLRRRRSSAD